MTSLDFINLEIATVKKDYKYHINFGQINFAIADVKRLKHLQQIKIELEAWYSVKSGLIYEKESKHRMSEEMRCSYVIYLTDDEMESIQKALEVNENE